jgi:hypothetical protein
VLVIDSDTAKWFERLVDGRFKVAALWRLTWEKLLAHAELTGDMTGIMERAGRFQHRYLHCSCFILASSLRRGDTSGASRDNLDQL